MGSSVGVTAGESVTLDELAFETMINRHTSRLFAIALAILRDRGEAEDAVQESLWKAWKARAKCPEEQLPRQNWLVRICVNHCLDRRSFLGIRPFHRGTPDRDMDRQASPRVEKDSADSDELSRAMNKLSPKQRAALTLHHVYGYSVGECAELMNCGAGSVRTHLTRGLTALRREIAHV